MQRILQKATASVAPSGPEACFCLPFLRVRCRHILQNERQLVGKYVDIAC
jgi:hypothetical protein